MTTPHQTVEGFINTGVQWLRLGIETTGVFIIVVGVLVATQAVIAMVMVFCVSGALVPDLDAVESKIKHFRILGIKPFVPVSRTLNRNFGHRGLLYSLRGWLIWTLLILPTSMTIGWLPVAALSFGYASHLVGHACTRTGIPLLYPKQVRWFLLPPRLQGWDGCLFLVL